MTSIVPALARTGSQNRVMGWLPLSGLGFKPFASASHWSWRMRRRTRAFLPPIDLAAVILTSLLRVTPQSPHGVEAPAM